MMNHTAHYAILAALLFAGSAVLAADSTKDKAETRTITLKNGKVLQDAYILDKKPNGVTFGYKEGAAFVRYSDMPTAAQKYFNYDEEEAANYEKKINAQKEANKKAAEQQKAKEQKQKSERDKRNRERQISQQEQKVRKLELELEEAKKQLSYSENTVSQDRGALVSTLNDNQVSIDNPWGFRTKTSQNNAAVRNKLMKEVDTLSFKRDNQAQEVIDLQLRLESAQKTLDKMRESSD